MSDQFTGQGSEAFSKKFFIFGFVSKSVKFLSWVLVLLITSFGILLGFDEKYVFEHEIKVDLQEYVAWMENEFMGNWREGESFKRQLRRAPIPKTDPVRLLHSGLYFNWVEGFTTTHESWWEYVAATRPIRNLKKERLNRNPIDYHWQDLNKNLGSDFKIAMNSLQLFCTKRDFNRYNGYYTKLTKLCMKYDVNLDHALWEPWKNYRKRTQ